MIGYKSINATLKRISYNCVSFFCVAFSSPKMQSHHVFRMSDSSVFTDHVGLATQNSALVLLYLQGRSNFGPNFTFSIALLCPQAQRSEQFVENFSPNPKANTVYCEVSKCALARTSNGARGGLRQGASCQILQDWSWMVLRAASVKKHFTIIWRALPSDSNLHCL